LMGKARVGKLYSLRRLSQDQNTGDTANSYRQAVLAFYSINEFLASKLLNFRRDFCIHLCPVCSA
jgi:hypothetical protein